jgi:hypothetical protein
VGSFTAVHTPRVRASPRTTASYKTQSHRFKVGSFTAVHTPRVRASPRTTAYYKTRASNGLTRTMKCMSIYCPLNMCKCNSYTSFNICSIKTCLNWQFTYYLSIHIKQHFMNQHAFHIFIHKSYESNAHQHIIIKLIANKSHTGQTHSLNISYSQYTQ